MNAFKMIFGKKTDFNKFDKKVVVEEQTLPEILDLEIKNESKKQDIIKFETEIKLSEIRDKANSGISKEEFAKSLNYLLIGNVYEIEGLRYKVNRKPNMPNGSYLPFFMLTQKGYITRI